MSLAYFLTRCFLVFGIGHTILSAQGAPEHLYRALEREWNYRQAAYVNFCTLQEQQESHSSQDMDFHEITTWLSQQQKDAKIFNEKLSFYGQDHSQEKLYNLTQVFLTRDNATALSNGDLPQGYHYEIERDNIPCLGHNPHTIWGNVKVPVLMASYLILTMARHGGDPWHGYSEKDMAHHAMLYDVSLPSAVMDQVTEVPFNHYMGGKLRLIHGGYVGRGYGGGSQGSQGSWAPGNDASEMAAIFGFCEDVVPADFFLLSAQHPHERIPPWRRLARQDVPQPGDLFVQSTGEGYMGVVQEFNAQHHGLTTLSRHRHWPTVEEFMTGDYMGMEGYGLQKFSFLPEEKREKMIVAVQAPSSP